MRRSRLSDAGRTAHKGATQQLEKLAKELASVVRTMDARNRLRFKDNRQLLESWISASTVLGVGTGGSAMGRGGGAPPDGTGESAGWGAGGGRRSEARSVTGVGKPGDGVGQPPPRDRDFRRRFRYSIGMLSQAGGDEIGPDPIPAR